MKKSIDLIIITASNGNNLNLAQAFEKKSKELKLSTQILDLTQLKIPLYNPRFHAKSEIPDEIKDIKQILFQIDKWIICAPEYNGSIPPILSNFIAWLSVSGDDFRNLFNGQPIAIATFSGGQGIELLTSLRIQLSHLGSQVLGRHLSSCFSKPAEEKTIEDIIRRLMQMKKLVLSDN
tara:strand:+ start:1264 stop:1797 length:534 start_codon:yes stop_codon:yes gene_type:complete